MDVVGSEQDHGGGEDLLGLELVETGDWKFAPLGYQNRKHVLGVRSQDQVEVGCRIQLDHGFGEPSADSAPRGFVAPEDPDVVVGAGADGKGDVSRPPVLLLLQTCVCALCLVHTGLCGSGQTGYR